MSIIMLNGAEYAEIKLHLKVNIFCVPCPETLSFCRSLDRHWNFYTYTHIHTHIPNHYGTGILIRFGEK